MNDSIIEKNAECIEIGNVKLYCEKVKVAASAVLFEESTVGGTAVITNLYRKASRFVFSGRVYDGDCPMETTARLHNLLGSPFGFNVAYRGIQLNNCILQAFTSEETDRGYSCISVTLAVSEDILPDTEVNT